MLDAELIIYLQISEVDLRKRVTGRGSNWANVIGMRDLLESEIEVAELPVVRFEVA